MADRKEPQQRYHCREISQLQFNRRVVMQGADKSNPILERLRFLCIASRNLDEFFEVRVASLRQLVKYGNEVKSGEGLTAREILSEISAQTHDIVKLQYRLLQKSVFAALRNRNILFLRRHEWSREQRQWVRQYFRRNILPILSPLGLDSRHPLPAGAEQKPQFHGQAVRQGRLWPQHRVRRGHRPASAPAHCAPARRSVQKRRQLRIFILDHPR